MVVRWLTGLIALALLLTGGASPASATHDRPSVGADDGDDSVDTEYQGGSDDPQVSDPSDSGGTETVPASCIAGPITLIPIILCTAPCDHTINIGGIWLRVPDDCQPRISISAVRGAVAEQIRHRMPALSPQRQPVGSPALPRLPVIFSSGQEGGPMTWTDQVAGLSVTTTVTPEWHWTFGDGGEMTTAQPGGPWPDTSVSHSYDAKGTYEVSVTTTWDGTFTIAGVGTFPITGQVTQEASMQVPVRPARAVLVPRDRPHRDGRITLVWTSPVVVRLVLCPGRPRRLVCRSRSLTACMKMSPWHSASRASRQPTRSWTSTRSRS